MPIDAKPTAFTSLVSRTRRCLVAVVIAIGALVGAAPAGAITGGTEDTANQYSNVGMVVFYQPGGRVRCSGTLIEPRVVLTAAHCTFRAIGKVAVTFDPVIARTAEEAERDIPRAADDTGPADSLSEVGFTGSDITSPNYEGEQTWFLGATRTHPQYSDFTDFNNWNDSGVVFLSEAPGLPTSPLAPEYYLNEFAQPQLNGTEFLTIGYGTEVRRADSGPQAPTPQRLPLVRRYTTGIGQKLTDQILQLNGNEHDIRAGGGGCFGDSGGPGLHAGFVVADTSFGYTDNCRYLGAYQRVDIPVVRDWLLDCTEDLDCPTKP